MEWENSEVSLRYLNHSHGGMPSCDTVDRCMFHFSPASLGTLVSSPIWSPLSGLPRSHFKFLWALVPFPSCSWFHTTKHLGPFFTQNLPLLFNFSLNKCSYSPNLNEPISPKVCMVLHGFTVLLHPRCPPTPHDHQALDLQLERSFLKLIY